MPYPIGMRGNGPEFLRERNRLRILEALRRVEPVSRVQIAQLTGLGAATVSEIVADLIDRRFLLEKPAKASGRGRPPVLLELNADGARVVGVLVDTSGMIDVEIADLRGNRLFKAQQPFALAAPGEELVAQLAKTITQLIGQSGLEPDMIHSVGLGLPAMVDSERGVLRWLPPHPAEDFPLAPLLQERLGIPVSIDTIVALMARAERWFGRYRGIDDFTLVALGMGIGLAQYVDGALQSGGAGASPEFGHVAVTLDGGPICFCGSRGCLSAYASIYGITERAREAFGWPFAPIDETFGRLLGAVQAGDAQALQIIDLAGRALGTAVSNHIHLWQPPRIEIAIDSRMRELIHDIFWKTLRERTLPPLFDSETIEFRSLADVATTQGAAAFVLERLYRTEGPEHVARRPA